MENLDLATILRELEIQISQRKLYAYKPFGHPDTLCPDGELWKLMQETNGWETWSNKPWQLEFHQAGKTCQERMIMAGNRTGKTWPAAVETAFHMTGEYPDWWDGKVFHEPVLVWTGSPTNETAREIVQKSLLGGTDPENLGTGTIPRDKIIGQPKMRQAGVSDVVDIFKVRHVSGGVSICVNKTYEQGWRKWQGTEPHIVWLDEEPDMSELQKRIYTEALTRLLTSHGIMMVTFSPLLGQTDLVTKFQKGGKGVFMSMASWDDAPHLNNEEKERMKSQYPDYEVQTRTLGIPMMGEGRVFKVPEEDIVIRPIHDIPLHWGRIKGIDFGIDHPAALAEIAWDRDNDVIYVIKTWRKNGCDSEEHAEEINKRDPWVPVSWPHDGTTREKSNGIRLKDFYTRKSVKMLSLSARYTNEKGGGQEVEPIVLEVNERCRNGGLKVFDTCSEFLEEYRNYHREGGKIVPNKDDVLKATFYAIMMKRFCAQQLHRQQKEQIPHAFTMRL